MKNSTHLKIFHQLAVALMKTSPELLLTDDNPSARSLGKYYLEATKKLTAIEKQVEAIIYADHLAVELHERLKNESFLNVLNMTEAVGLRPTLGDLSSFKII